MIFSIVRGSFGLMLLVIFGLSLVVLPLVPALAQDSSTQITVRVDGLSCPFCAYGLEKKLKRLEGAEEVRINLDQGLVEIRVTKGKTIEESLLRQAVKDSGFTPRKITYPSLHP